MSDCRFGVSPVNYPDPDLVEESELKLGSPGLEWFPLQSISMTRCWCFYNGW